eukprot:g640.t1
MLSTKEQEMELEKKQEEEENEAADNVTETEKEKGTEAEAEAEKETKTEAEKETKTESNVEDTDRSSMRLYINKDEAMYAMNNRKLPPPGLNIDNNALVTVKLQTVDLNFTYKNGIITSVAEKADSLGLVIGDRIVRIGDVEAEQSNTINGALKDEATSRALHKQTARPLTICVWRVVTKGGKRKMVVQKRTKKDSKDYNSIFRRDSDVPGMLRIGNKPVACEEIEYRLDRTVKDLPFKFSNRVVTEVADGINVKPGDVIVKIQGLTVQEENILLETSDESIRNMMNDVSERPLIITLGREIIGKDGRVVRYHNIPHTQVRKKTSLPKTSGMNLYVEEPYQFKSHEAIPWFTKIRCAYNEITFEYENPGPFAVHHNSYLRRAWDFITVGILINLGILMPVEIAFEVQSTALVIQSNFVDVWFILDLVLNFCTTIRHKDSTMKQEITVYSHKQIALSYLKGWFVVDFISSIPFNHFIPSDSMGSINSSSITQMIKLTKLLKLLRMLRAGRLIQKIQEYFQITYGTILIAKFAIYICILSHWLGLLFYIIAKTENSPHSWIQTYANGAVINDNGQPLVFEDFSSFEKYSTLLYWAITTMTTIGYGDITPKTHSERLFVTISMMIGAAAFAYGLTNICSAIFNNNLDEVKFHALMDSVGAYLNRAGVSDATIRKVNQYLWYRHTLSSISIFSEQEIVLTNNLCPSLHRLVFLRQALTIFPTNLKRVSLPYFFELPIHPDLKDKDGHCKDDTEVIIEKAENDKEEDDERDKHSNMVMAELKGKNIHLLEALVRAMSPIAFGADEIIFSRLASAHFVLPKILFLVRGNIRIKRIYRQHKDSTDANNESNLENGKTNKMIWAWKNEDHIKAGCSVGEIPTLLGPTAPEGSLERHCLDDITIVSITCCDIYALSKERFEQAFEAFPVERSALLYGLQKVNETMKFKVYLNDKDMAHWRDYSKKRCEEIYTDENLMSTVLARAEEKEETKNGEKDIEAMSLDQVRRSIEQVQNSLDDLASKFLA